MAGVLIVHNEAMEQRRRLGIHDALWLEMDKPNNLMVVDSVVWTAEPLDFGKVRAAVSYTHLTLPTIYSV